MEIKRYGDSDRQEMDIILLLSQRAVYIAWYDDVEEQVYQYQRIFLEDIEKLEIGSEPSFFKSKTVVMRLHYRHYADEGFFHTVKMPSTRLFNNLVITIKTPEEAKEQLNVIAETFVAAQNILSIELNVEEKQKLEKKKTKPHPEVMDIHQQQQENSLAKIKLPRDISSSDISSQNSSCKTSPMFARKATSSSAKGSTEKLNTFPSDARRKNEKNTMISPSRMKAWLPNMSKLNKAKFPDMGGSFDLPVPKINLSSLNLVSKMKMGRAGAGRLLSKVSGTSIFYVNNQDELEQPKIEIKDSIDGQVKSKTKTSRVRTYSRDDSTVDEPTEITQSDLEKEALLGSCGILATNTKQILESPQCSFEEPDDDMDSDALDDMTEDVFQELVGNKTNTKVLEGNSTKPSGSKIVFGLDEPVVRQTDKIKMYDTDQGNIARTKLDKEVKAESNHKFGPEITVEVISKLEGNKDSTEKISKPTGLDFGQRRVIEHSEADQILEKYSQSKKNLTQTGSKKSPTVAAATENPVTMTIENYSQESPKSVLEFDMEINSHLKQQLPNLLQSSKMSKKTQRIYENLKSHIEEKLGDTTCQSTIILI